MYGRFQLAAGLKSNKSSLGIEHADEGNLFEWEELGYFLLLAICKCASYTHTHKATHTFGHGPEGGVNRLTGGWAVSTVDSNYFLKGSYVACLKRGGLMLRGHLRKWNSPPLAEGKVLPLRFDRHWDSLVSNGVCTAQLLWQKTLTSYRKPSQQ